MAVLTQSATCVPPPRPELSAALDEQSVFAFARILGEVCLVQMDPSLASLKTPHFSDVSPVELTVYRHEFGTMFRLARRATLQTRDVQFLMTLDDVSFLYDVDSGVVFLSREMTDELLRYTSPRRRRRMHVPLRTRC